MRSLGMGSHADSYICCQIIVLHLHDLSIACFEIMYACEFLNGCYRAQFISTQNREEVEEARIHSRYPVYRSACTSVLTIVAAYSPTAFTPHTLVFLSQSER